MTTHISYKTAKVLKEFLGNKAPKPLDGYYFWKNSDTDIRTDLKNMCHPKAKHYPFYGLHDLLSKPFCAAMAKKHPQSRALAKYGYGEDVPWDIANYIMEMYFNKGMASVEKVLVEMMEAK
jgi:hypothetical protein